MQIDDIDNLRIVGNVHIPFEITSNVDELVMRFMFMRRVLVTFMIH